MAKRIICYGDVIDDVIVIPEGTILPDTDTPSSIRIVPGGSAANTAAWLAYGGAAVDFVGVVGQGDRERHTIALPGVRTHLREHRFLQTGRIVIIVQGDRRDMLTDRGANMSLSPNDISESVLQAASIVHLTGHTLLNETGSDGIRSLIDRCHDTDVVVSISPGSAGLLAQFEMCELRSLFQDADILMSGYDDGRLLTGLEQPEAIAAALRGEHGVCVVTLGSLGYAVADGSDTFVVSIEPRETVDPTGAGDAFCAGFLQQWLEVHDARIAAVAAAERAAIAVGGAGGRPPCDWVKRNPTIADTTDR